MNTSLVTVALHNVILKKKYVYSTVKLDYNELGYNEPPVITNTFLSPKSMYNTQITPVIMNSRL